MGEGTKVISLADAMARIEVLEATVRDLIAMEHADVFSLREDVEALTKRHSSATQVAEAA